MHDFSRLIQGLWFGGSGWARTVSGLISPISGLTRWYARRARYAIERLPAPQPPVVIIGNLLAGGTGKTPLTIAVARALAASGLRIGLLCSGYGAARHDARMVSADDDAALNGDEPVLLACATGLPVAAGRRRDQALEQLRLAAPGLDLVLSDDGLQHRHLPRTAEVIVFDARGLGNGRLLPAGPLREPLPRGRPLQAVALNEAEMPAGVQCERRFHFRIEPVGLSRLDGSEFMSIESFRAWSAEHALCALAGIGDPDRFFRSLHRHGIHPSRTLALPDHAPITAADLRAIDEPLILMTEKDAVKCRGFADQRCWVLRVEARVDPALIAWLQEIARGIETA